MRRDTSERVRTRHQEREGAIFIMWFSSLLLLWSKYSAIHTLYTTYIGDLVSSSQWVKIIYEGTMLFYGLNT